mmetsp:Transcript_18009/g.41658  ORF Transcript_18009/g.41658 Transcript_18009/m.41658 type:complete len:111 (+) Transcript_18009:1386-1718(+)
MSPCWPTRKSSASLAMYLEIDTHWWQGKNIRVPEGLFFHVSLSQQPILSCRILLILGNLFMELRRVADAMAAYGEAMRIQGQENVLQLDAFTSHLVSGVRLEEHPSASCA